MCDCELGWLPTDGIQDDVLDDCVLLSGKFINSGTLILWPTEYTACFHCNPESWSNGDLVQVSV